MFRGLDCNVFIRPRFEVDDCLETIINWGDGNIDVIIGDFELDHEYQVDGKYELCVSFIQRNNQGVVCNELQTCNSICVECGIVCQEEELVPIVGYSYPNYFREGYISKQSDVQYYGDDLYAVFSEEEVTGGTTIHVLKNGLIVFSIPNSIETQVSEIKIHDDYIYLTGSFGGGDMQVPSSVGNGTSLINNCYAAGSCLHDGFVIKYTSAFTLEWAFSIGGTWIDAVEDITIINDEEFAITGITRNDSDFDPNDNEVELSDQSNSIKSFIAKYSVNNNYPLPVCDWVNTLYVQDGYLGSAAGLGITHDDLGNIYAGGNYASGLIDGNTQAMQLYSSTNGSTLPGFSVPAGKYFGYIIKYDSLGGLIWSRSIGNNGTGLFRNNYISDLEIAGNELFAGGLNTFTKYDLNGVPLITPIIEPGLDINEIAISGNQLFIVGFVNDTYRNLDLLLPPGQGPQITSPLNVLFSVYNLDVEYQKSLNPGGDYVDYGMGISAQDEKIAICGNTTSGIFDAGHPGVNPNGVIFNLASERDFFVAEYNCECVSYTEIDAACCEDVSSVIKEDESEDFCCSISISNDQGITISAINIELLNGSEFSSGQLDISNDFNINMISASSVDITYNSGFIPTGIISPILDFCLNQNSGTSSDYVISYIEEDAAGNTYVLCRDTLSGDCGIENEISDCATISEINAVCLDGEDSYYEVDFTLSNESNSIIEELQLSGLPNGFSWSPCDVVPPIINTVLDVNIPALPPGQSTQVCVRIYSNNPITISTDLDFLAVMIDDDGKSFCCAHDNSIMITPCCTDCDDIQLEVKETRSCCYSLTMSGFCNTNEYRELNISSPLDIDIVNTNISSSIAVIQPWILCNTSSGDLCIEPRGGIFSDNAGQNEITFCLSGAFNGNDDLIFEFRNDKQDVVCSKVDSVQCDGGCVSEGFIDPGIKVIGGLVDDLRLECNQPPLILDCPSFNEVFIKGRFDCSESCSSELSGTVLFNGQEIKPKEAEVSDGTWEIRLTDLIKNPGLYEIVIEGTCDGVSESCTYSFEIRQDCFECLCDDLEKDIHNFLSINTYSDCIVEFEPVSLKPCDIVNHYTIDGDRLSGPFQYDESIIYMFPGSGTYEVCMNVSRMDEKSGELCKKDLCEEFFFTCKETLGVSGFCNSMTLSNNSFDGGVPGSLNNNDKTNLPGWQILDGEAYYFIKGGARDTISGFIQQVSDKITGPSIIEAIINSEDVVPGDKNEILLEYDFRASSESVQYIASIVIGDDTLRHSTKTTSKFNWQSEQVVFEVDNEIITMLEAGIGEIQFTLLAGNEDIKEFVSLDNVCVDIEKMNVNVSNVSGNSEVKVYPNPSRGQFNVDFASSKSMSKVLVYDSEGRSILELNNLGANNVLDLSTKPSGVYIMKVIFSSGDFEVMKLIKIN
jgi:hypothetical protein